MVAIDNSKRTEILRTQEQTLEQRLVDTNSEFVADRKDGNPVMDDEDFNKLLGQTEATFKNNIDKTASTVVQREQFARTVNIATEDISDSLDRILIPDKILSQEQLALLDAVRQRAIPGVEEESARLREEERKNRLDNINNRSQAALRARIERERQEKIQGIQSRTGASVQRAEQIIVEDEAAPVLDNVTDIKARLRPFPSQAQQIYGTEDATNLPTIMSILDGRQPGGTNGVIFPYTPIIQYTPTTEYAKYDPVHANTDYQTYFRTQAVQIQLTGHFTAQSPKEAVYCLAVIHFLRTITKMRFGKSDDRRGEPPPVLLFDCYGWYMFNRLPVIITGFSIPYEKDIDYVPVDTRPFFDSSSLNKDTLNAFDKRHVPNGFDNPDITWLPANFNISISMYVQIPPKTWRKDFDLDKFRTGEQFSQQNGISVFGRGNDNKSGSLGGWI